MAKSATPSRVTGELPEPPIAPSYEAALAELDALVERMESAQMPLDGLLEAHRRASALLAFCRQRLEAVQQQVQVLEDGQLKPWPGATPVTGTAA
jgi:exodeoxyribonuclease VII small subunit